MNSYNEPNGLYGAIEVMALDYVFRLLARKFGNKRKHAAQGEPRTVAAPLAVSRPMDVVPATCGC